jgi:hypothetical protein
MPRTTKRARMNLAPPNAQVDAEADRANCTAARRLTDHAPDPVAARAHAADGADAAAAGADPSPRRRQP